MNDTKKHVLWPNKTDESSLNGRDGLVYLTIKRYENKDTHESFPSINTIMEKTLLGKDKIRASIKKLEKEGYISIVKRNKKPNVYKFNPYKKFEVFSEDFLDSDLSVDEKAYIIAVLRYMFKDQLSHMGILLYSDSKITEITNMSRREVSKVNKSLKEKGLMKEKSLKVRDKETGIILQERFFNLDKLSLAVIFKLMDHEEKIENVTDRIALLEKLAREKDEEMRKLKELLYKKLGDDIVL